MEIKNLKDLKEALKDTPDEVLEEFGVAQHEEPHLQLVTFTGEDPNDDANEYYSKHTGKYPLLNDVNKWIENISKAQIKLVEKDYGIDEFQEEFISSKDKIE